MFKKSIIIYIYCFLFLLSESLLLFLQFALCICTKSHCKFAESKILPNLKLSWLFTAACTLLYC